MSHLILGKFKDSFQSVNIHFLLVHVPVIAILNQGKMQGGI